MGCVLWKNFWLMLYEYFSPFLFAFLGAMEPISIIFVSSTIFTNLKGFKIVSGTAMNLQSYSSLGSLVWLDVKERYALLKLYWLTLDIVSGVRTFDERSYNPSYISLACR